MPARRTLFIHAGLPKTGTSFLQGVFFGSVEALAAQDLALVPADQHDHLRVTLSIRDLLQDFDNDHTRAAMDRLRAEAAACTASKVLFTHESLAPCTPSQAQALIDAFGDAYDVHVIVTARDPGRQIPSAWQQRMQARLTFTYDEFVEAVFARTELAGDFWANQDLADVVRRWSSVVPPAQLHVITCPPPGAPSTLLLERFCSVLGIDPAPLSLERRVDNVALGQPQAELLRRVNVALGDRFPHIRDGYRRLGQVFLAGQVLRPQHGRVAQLPASRRDATDAIAREWIALITAAGFDVVGSLDELLPLEASFAASSAEITSEELVDVAATALADILEIRDTELREKTRLERSLARAEEQVRALQDEVHRLSGGREALKTLGRKARRRLSRG